jgi:E3 ubiquitin-protein ligase synoviolin
MADVAEDQAARLRREREEAMEQMLMEQQLDEILRDDDNDENEAAAGHHHHVEDENNPGMRQQEGDVMLEEALAEDPPPPPVASHNKGLSYTTTSFLLAAAYVWYALRTREQWYLALVFLGSSKLAYCIIGNALVAAAVVAFHRTTALFLGGLRVQEAEGLQDFFRWNVTETCLALTMFRHELTIGVAVQFLILVLVKCLHHVAVLREQHVRLTEEAVRASEWNPAYPMVPTSHVKALLFLVVLQSFDVWAFQYMGEDLLTTGPSVSVLFAFEAAILLVSAWSAILLWYLHAIDGLLHFWHDQQLYLGQVLLHPWKEHKATLTFAVELQSQSVQFLFYLAFFGLVMTYYGVPINLFREVYVSFMALKERIFAFLKYRRLMVGMNRFATPTAEQLEESGPVCIICRDDMTVHDCKALPVCQHLFHKSCLREWLTQQQSCPTCRSDISQMQARQAAADAAVDRGLDGHADGETEEQAVTNDAMAPFATDDDEHDNSPVPDVDPAEVGAGVAPIAPARRRTGVVNESFLETAADSSETKTPCTAAPPKKVHFSDGPGETLVLSFPALYRVVQSRASVVNLEAALVVRRLPLGSIVFGTDLKEHTYQGKAQSYIRLADGWVADEAVWRVYDKLPGAM